MGGRGPAPKPAQLRQRRNKKVTKATLTPTIDGEIPELLNPDGREFHPLTEQWWEKVWSSPMASEYLETDVEGLGRLAILIDDFYNNPKAKTMQEIRLQEARFGLSPVDRSRLQWEIAKGEEAERKRKPKTTAPKSAKDPRGVLGVVK